MIQLDLRDFYKQNGFAYSQVSLKVQDQLCSESQTDLSFIMVNNMFNKCVREKIDMIINYVDGWDMEGDGSVRRVNYFETIKQDISEGQ